MLGPGPSIQTAQISKILAHHLKVTLPADTVQVLQCDPYPMLARNQQKCGMNNSLLRTRTAGRHGFVKQGLVDVDCGSL